jgi:thiamine pyrophosphate-dependent acetolactate synthase large subunit-like protein
MLMNLGCLATLAAHPAKVYLLILDNGIYEVTGGQATAGQGRTDFATLARGAGIKRVYAFDNLNAWETGAAEALNGDGPVVIWLKVEARLGQKTPKPPRSMPEQLRRLREGLGVK